MNPGGEFYNIWGADKLPEFPDDGSPYDYYAYFPPKNGFRFGLFTIPPASIMTEYNLDIEAAIKEIEEKLPGMLAHFEPGDPAMHTTDTIDYEYIISGEIWLELDNGEEVHLKAGDTVVQNGTRHAWRNRSTESCQMVICMIGVNMKDA